MKNLISLLLPLLSLQVIFSQSQPESVTNFLYDTRGAFYPGKQYFMAEPSPTDISGKIYLDEGWQEGVILSGDDESGNANIRYNVLSDEMQVLVNGQILALVSSKIKALRIGEQVFITAPYIRDQKLVSLGYFELLADGKIQLLRKYKCITQPTEYHPAVATAKDQEYVIESEFYFRLVKDYAKPLKRGKKSILAVFPDGENEMKIYAEKHELNLKKEEAIIQLFNFYNLSVKKT